MRVEQSNIHSQLNKDVTSYISDVRNFHETRATQSMAANGSGVMTASDQVSVIKQLKPTLQGNHVVDKLIENYETQYVKKFPFEKGQYHQCIPNPINSDEFITVQLVTRQTESILQPDLDDLLLNNEEGVNIDDKMNPIHGCQHYQRFQMTLPEEDKLDDEYSEGEDANEDNDFSRKRSNMRTKSQLLMLNSGDRLSSRISQDALQKLINDEKRLNEEVDPLTGCTVSNFSKLEEAPNDGAYIASTEIAVISFWRFNSDNNVFRCYNFFNVPNPMKRMIRDQEGTLLYEVLFKGQENDIFFFYQLDKSIEDCEAGLYYAQLNLEGSRFEC